MNPTTLVELGGFLRAGEEEVFALLTRPAETARNQAVILLQGGAWTPSFGRGRALRRLAERLAARGFHVARFDYHGVGESSGEVRTFRLDQPFVEDLMAVVKWLATDHQVDRFVLMGTCFGARTALAAAPKIPGLDGIALFPPPVRDYALGEQFASYPFTWYLRKLFRVRTFKRILSGRFRKAYRRLMKNKAQHVGKRLRGDRAQTQPANEVSAEFVSQLAAVIARDVPVYLLYGDADADYADFQRAHSVGPLGALLGRAKSRVRIDVIKGHVHGMTSLENQGRVIDLLEEWVSTQV